MTVGRADGVVRPSSGELAYEADSAGHRVLARYADGRVAFAFGSFGHGFGQFDTPLDVVTIWPEFSGEPGTGAGLASIVTPWLAVADYGNHRIQFFECDGAWIGETDLEPGRPPCQLAWRTPTLEVTTIEGQALRIHVAAALLSGTGRAHSHERPVHRDPRQTWRVC